MIFTDENGHIVVTFGEGTTSIIIAKEEGSEIDNTIFFANQETKKPLGESNPEQVGLNSDTLPAGSVRLVFTGDTPEQKVNALWNFLHLIDPLVEAHRKVMAEYSKGIHRPGTLKSREG